ncbi:DUF3775 domain-containing protein [Inquilinus limosus]|uniref:DUF3775 domain-containing protein n=1 Tax=Inquilinus limosus TaxID=171674 RepID=UPI00040D879D|nr:DUF3775 domain-containing protein [Inquilinus limosus]
MITIPLEKLAYIVAKARAFDAEVPPVDDSSGSNPSDDGSRDILEDTPDNPTYAELVDAIDSLSDEERVELLALVWLGRGDVTREEWPEVLEQAKDLHDERETDYLVGTPLLGDYIAEGLGQFGTSLEEFEVGRM